MKIFFKTFDKKEKIQFPFFNYKEFKSVFAIKFICRFKFGYNRCLSTNAIYSSYFSPIKILVVLVRSNTSEKVSNKNYSQLFVPFTLC